VSWKGVPLPRLSDEMIGDFEEQQITKLRNQTQLTGDNATMKHSNQQIEKIIDIFKDIYRSTKHGYSIMELLVAVGVSFVGLSGGFMLYQAGQETLNTATTTSEMQQGFRKAFETMTQELQETDGATVDVSVPNAISFASAWDSSNFTMNADGSPDWKHAVVYFWNSSENTLCRYTSPKDDWSTLFDTASAFTMEDREELVSDVTGIQFQLSGKLLTITATITPTNQAGYTSTLSTQVYLHNSN
jgi:hypothetical protein